MRTEECQAEKAIALAFLRKGHPWLAFGTVIVNSGARTINRMALLAICVVLGPGGGATAIVNSLPALL